MRIVLITFAIVLALAGGPVAAQVIDPDGPRIQPIQPDEQAIVPPVDDVPLVADDHGVRLDELFARLQRISDPRLARPIADSIWSQWFRSDSASIDLLMQWSEQAAHDRRFSMALDFLDQVTMRAPGFAEGWNRRATVHFNMRNDAKSMRDIQKVLELEPRHFGALSGMAIIFERNGNKNAALAAWQRALAVYPALETAQTAIIRLSDQLAGDPV